jgi:hypothetical protein
MLDKMAATAPLQNPSTQNQNQDQAAPMETKQSLEAKMAEYAPFAKAAYGADGNGNNRSAMAGYHIDPRFTNGNRVLYASDTDKNKAVYAFRGTSVSNWGDIGTDVLNTIGLNRFSARNNNAANAAKAAQSQYSNLTLTGHSLGAEEALYAAKSMKTPPAQTVTFAPHVNYFQALGDKIANKFHDFFFKPKERQPSNTFIYKTQSDPVSAYVSPHYLNAHISTVRETNALNPHAMDNFINP